MDPIAELMLERVQNLGMVVQTGSSPTHALMAEIVVLQVKLDALMMLIDDKKVLDIKTELEPYVKKAAADGIALAKNIRAMMMSQKKR